MQLYSKHNPSFIVHSCSSSKIVTTQRIKTFVHEVIHLVFLLDRGCYCSQVLDNTNYSYLLLPKVAMQNRGAEEPILIQATSVDEVIIYSQSA